MKNPFFICNVVEQIFTHIAPLAPPARSRQARMVRLSSLAQLGAPPEYIPACRMPSDMFGVPVLEINDRSNKGSTVNIGGFDGVAGAGKRVTLAEAMAMVGSGASESSRDTEYKMSRSDDECDGCGDSRLAVNAAIAATVQGDGDSDATAAAVVVVADGDDRDNSTAIGRADAGGGGSGRGADGGTLRSCGGGNTGVRSTYTYCGAPCDDLLSAERCERESDSGGVGIVGDAIKSSKGSKGGTAADVEPEAAAVVKGLPCIAEKVGDEATAVDSGRKEQHPPHTEGDASSAYSSAKEGSRPSKCADTDSKPLKSPATESSDDEKLDDAPTQSTTTAATSSGMAVTEQSSKSDSRESLDVRSGEQRTEAGEREVDHAAVPAALPKGVTSSIVGKSIVTTAAEATAIPTALGKVKMAVSAYAGASREFGRLGECITPAEMVAVVREGIASLADDAKRISVSGVQRLDGGQVGEMRREGSLAESNEERGMCCIMYVVGWYMIPRDSDASGLPYSFIMKFGASSRFSFASSPPPSANKKHCAER